MDATFAELLRAHRVGAGLTQERLAELAGLSATAIAALEAGRRCAPRAGTVGALGRALGLERHQRGALAAASRPAR